MRGNAASHNRSVSAEELLPTDRCRVEDTEDMSVVHSCGERRSRCTLSMLADWQTDIRTAAPCPCYLPPARRQDSKVHICMFCRYAKVKRDVWFLSSSVSRTQVKSVPRAKNVGHACMCAVPRSGHAPSDHQQTTTGACNHEQPGSSMRRAPGVGLVNIQHTTTYNDRGPTLDVDGRLLTDDDCQGISRAASFAPLRR
jgi:hypothetical protein